MNSQSVLAMQKRTAFTLVELLVLIAIISILAALLLPALDEAMTSARIISCMNNQKQIALGMSMYLDDSDQLVPPSYNYTDDGTLYVFKNQPATRWYVVRETPKLPMRVGYVFPEYVEDGHVFLCTELTGNGPMYYGGASAPSYTGGTGNDLGWYYAEPGVPTAALYANSHYYSLGIDDALTQALASVPSDYRNYYNVYKTRSLKPRVHNNLHLPMLCDVGSLGNAGATVLKAHQWRACNVAYWDASVVSIPGVEAFLWQKYGTGPTSVYLASTYGIDFVLRK